MGTTTAQPTQYEAARQLSDNNSLGTILGQSAADLIGFYGVNATAASPTGTGVAQPAGAAQAAITRGSAVGSIATIAATSVTPSTVATATTSEYVFSPIVVASTAWQVATTDIVIVNKPTAASVNNAGVGNARVTTANTVNVNFSNFSATTTCTPTATSWNFVAIRGMNPISVTLTPKAVPANTIAEQIFTVSGLRSSPTTLVYVTKPTQQAGLDIVGARIVGPNQLGIAYVNVTSSTTPITPTSESYTVLAMDGLDAQNNELAVSLYYSTAATVATTVAVEQIFAVTNLAASDVVVGLSKATVVPNLGIVQYRVSSAGNMGVTFYNNSSTTTATTVLLTDIYNFLVYRPAPVAPLVTYSVSIAPTSVAPSNLGTLTEQTFSVTGVVASSIVWVNKPTTTPNLGIAGVRASAANQIAITYVNSSAATITPATETYVVGNFQVPVGAAGTTWVQTASLTANTNAVLTNAMRSAQVALGLIAGA